MGARTACLCLSSILYPPSSRSTDAQQVLADCQCPTDRGILTGCFISFQLVSPGFSYQGKKSQTGRLKTYFQLRGTDAQQVFADCQCPSCHPVSLTERSAAIFSLSVSPCFTLRHAKTR